MKLGKPSTKLTGNYLVVCILVGNTPQLDLFIQSVCLQLNMNEVWDIYLELSQCQYYFLVTSEAMAFPINLIMVMHLQDPP